MTMRQQLIVLYLDYVNNWLTVQRFAEHHHVPMEVASQIIEIGKELNEADAADQTGGGEVFAAKADNTVTYEKLPAIIDEADFTKWRLENQYVLHYRQEPLYLKNAEDYSTIDLLKLYHQQKHNAKS